MATSQKKTGKKTGSTAAKKRPAAKSGTKKNTAARGRQTKAQAKEAEQRQMGAVILFGVALLMLCIAFIPGGGAWGALQQFFFGCFGIGFYIWPFVLAYVAFMASLQKDYRNLKVQVTEVAIFIWLICTAVFIGYNAEDMVGGFDQAIKDAYQAGGVHTNGGVFGAVLGGLFLLMTGNAKVPAMVVTIILILLVLMLLTGTTLNRLAKNIASPVKKAGEATKESYEQRAAANEERQQQRAERAAKRRAGYRFNPDVDLGPEFHGADAEEPSNTAGKSGRKGKKTATGATAAATVAAAGSAAEKAAEIASAAATAEATTPAPVKLDDIVAKAAARRAPQSKPADAEVAEKVEMPTPASLEKEDTSGYHLPPLDCLKPPKLSLGGSSEQELRDNAQKLVDVLRSFGVETTIVDIARGPSVTRYELAPAVGVKISKITGLADDIALNLAATGIRIEAPIPGKAAVGIEVPNKSRETVTLREILESDTYKKGTKKSLLNVALGRDISGNSCVADLAKMPHLLIAGTTGSGKSVCLNAMILSILYNAKPDEVKLIMIDPKKVEFSVYNGVPHLLVPVVSEPNKAAGALSWAVKEMLKRYRMFSENNVRDIAGYNELVSMDPEKGKMPHVVIFVDELADLMMATPKEVEDSICRLAQMARAAGMHLVIATQRPSVDVITGLIKANIPSRLSLSVSSAVDSRTILDMAGAEKLLGNGDLLFNPIGCSKPVRIQGCFTSDSEVEEVVNYIKKQGDAKYSDEVIKDIEDAAKVADAANDKSSGGVNAPSGQDDGDILLPDAIRVVIEAGQASTTLIQRKLKVGYARAGRIVDELEERGVIGPYEGSKPRKVLMTKNQWLEMNAMADAPDDGTAAAIELGVEDHTTTPPQDLPFSN